MWTAALDTAGRIAEADLGVADDAASPAGLPTDDQGWPGLFTSRETAEAFMGGDPLVINGVVVNPRILEWHELLDQ